MPFKSLQHLLISTFAASLLITACTPATPAGTNENISTSSSSTQTGSVTEAMILTPQSDGWRTHGGSYAEERFSPLSSVNTENIDQLGLAWSYGLGTSRGIEATGPLIRTSTKNRPLKGVATRLTVVSPYGATMFIQALWMDA